MNRILSFILTLRNPPYFAYRALHYLRHSAPYGFASRVAAKNRREYERAGVRRLPIETYDGSNQATHPDIMVHNGVAYLALTPYPYGMEEYENPCLYTGAGDCWTPLAHNPIDRQRIHTYGYHLSDPCLCEQDGKLLCIYRNSENRAGEVYNELICAEVSAEGALVEKRTVMSSSSDLLLSPAFIALDDGSMRAFHVAMTGEQESALVYTTFSCDLAQTGQIRLDCENMPAGYYVWHIGISFARDFAKRGSGEEALTGLFLIRRSDAAEGDDYRLFEATSESVGGTWIVGDEVLIPPAVKDDMQLVYKSCFIPENGKVLLSYRDKKDRYKLVVV